MTLQKCENKSVLFPFWKNHFSFFLFSYREHFVPPRRRLCSLGINADSFGQTEPRSFGVSHLHPAFQSKEYCLQKYQRSNQDTVIFQRPFVREGEWIQSGDLLADCSTSSGGEVCLGKNICIAYMPWEGYNYEDALLISQRLVSDDVYTSLHIESYEVETRTTKFGKEHFTDTLPDLSETETAHLDKRGIVRVGTSVKEGDILVGKVTPIQKKFISPYEKLLYTILEKELLPVRDTSLRTPKGLRAKVLEIKVFTSSSKHTFHSSKKTGHQRRFETSSVGSSLKTFHNSVFDNPFFCGSIPSSFCQWRSRLNTPFLFSKENSVSVEQSPHLFFFRSDPRIPSVWQNEKSVKKPDEKNFFRSFSLSLRSPEHLNTFLTWVSGQKKCVFPFLSHGSVTPSGPFRHHDEKTTSRLSSDHELFKVQVYLVEKRKIQVGDKMSGRHGNKGIVSQILPIPDMPFLPDGTPLDMVLNPLGVPSRMNVGQIYECVLGLASKYLHHYSRIVPFDEMYGAHASRSFTFSKLYDARQKTGQKWLFNPCFPGKMPLFDGRTGEPYQNPVTVGISYILKLVHLVDDKIHARSTGPYSLVIQQPLRGRSKYGGQRVGEMEVWAIEAYGAAFILLEMLTIKSDDISGRMTLWSNILLSLPIYIGTPESFKVLVCELQALCLDIGLYRLNKKGFLTQIEHLMQLP
jgi:DNA-directed RNA polymerase subunit beta